MVRFLQKSVRGRHVEFESLSRERRELLDRIDALQKQNEMLQAQFDTTARGNHALK